MFTCTLNGFSDELPLKSGFDQVHQASGFGAFELSQNPVFEDVRLAGGGAFQSLDFVRRSSEAL
jgi:hypothetical protein